MLLLEDLHWADEGSLDFLSHLVKVDRDVPMLMLGLARPDAVRAPRRLAGTADARRIDLAAARTQASRSLASELLSACREPPDAARARDPECRRQPVLHGGADKMLVDEGAIEARAEGWAARRRPARRTLFPRHWPACYRRDWTACTPARSSPCSRRR